MGKASKWLKNLLAGKKEDKDNKKDASLSSEDFVLPTASIPQTPNQKTRWSFGKSMAIKDNNNQKNCRSFDAISSKTLVPRDLLECWNQQNQGAKNAVTCFVEAKYGNEQKVTTGIPVPDNEGRQTVVPAPFAVAGQFRALGDAAATKIQAFFHGHLARTALKALRGLVKIQALVRGYLVRKQTSEMLRCMNALMSIQVRARFQRTRLTEEPHITVKRKSSHREPTHDQLRREALERLNLSKTTGSWRGNQDLTSHQPMKTREHEFRTYYSGKTSVSNQEHQFREHPNQSPLMDTSTQYGESSYGTPSRVPQQNYSVANFNHIKAPESPSVDYLNTTSHNSKYVHNYMANTQSSTAKLRSHSEPKQRPFRQKTKRSPSFGGIDSTPDNKKQNQSPNRKINQQPWLIKIYSAAKSSKDLRCESNSIGGS
ncbi:protein IQ-domain 26-like [Apium graveolens]|uniref:protein IQ-domain 26-like n=1 Tax=Apium graveolens TaxID=4045 RepID=UPI003D795212